jgi:diguanylate cyclase (GGDEF)-like protein
MLVICLARVALVFTFALQRAPLTYPQAFRWNASYAALLLLNSSSIAIASVYNFSHHDATAKVLMSAGAFIICSGLSARFGTRPWVEQSAGLIMMAGLFWGVLRSGEPEAWVFCVMILLFAYGHCVAVRTKFELVVELLRSRQKMRQFAEHDSLTDLPNRRQFRARLDEVSREPGSFAVLFLDLDGFKSINDNFGHAIGDELLRHVSRRLQGIIRDSDLVARLGGDEFALLHTPDASRSSAEALARRILQTVSAPYAIGGHSLSIGTSIGIQLSAHGTNKPEKLLSDADAALYKVKQEGKGSFRFITAPDCEVTA